MTFMCSKKVLGDMEYIWVVRQKCVGYDLTLNPSTCIGQQVGCKEQGTGSVGWTGEGGEADLADFSFNLSAMK